MRACVAGCFLKPDIYYQKYIELADDPSFLVRISLFNNIDKLVIPNLEKYIQSLDFQRLIERRNDIDLLLSNFESYIFSFILELFIDGILKKFFSTPSMANFPAF